jgi:DNA-binding transcriptional LysR family regulator
MIRILKTFIAVAQEGTFAKAGQKIGLTQAAVSAQIHRLEEDFGYAVFDRTGRTARLNRQGQEALVQAQELVRLYGEMSQRRQSPQPVGRVVIGAIASVQSSVLSEALACFHRSHSNVKTRIVPGVSLNLLNQVDAGEIDLAIMIRPGFAMHADLRWTTLSHEPFRVLVPQTSPHLGWRNALESLPFIRYERTSFGGRLVDRFLRETHLAVRECVEIDELDAIVQLVALGVGAALIPQTFGQTSWPKGTRALDLGAQTFYRDIGLLQRSSRLQQPATLELVNALEQLYGVGDPALAK